MWKALADSGQLAKWYMTRAKIDGRVGGTIDFEAGPSRLHAPGSRVLVEDPKSSGD